MLTVLSLPENPDRLLDEHTRTLDTAYRQVAARLGPDAKVTVDDERKVSGRCAPAYKTERLICVRTAVEVYTVRDNPATAGASVHTFKVGKADTKLTKACRRGVITTAVPQTAS